MALTALAAIIGAEVFKCPAGSDPRIFMVAVQRAGCRIGASGFNCDLGMYGRRVLEYCMVPCLGWKDAGYARRIRVCTTTSDVL